MTINATFRIRALALLIALAATKPSLVAAQGSRQHATRSELTAVAATLASRSDSSGRAQLNTLQARLRDGDFREGDRIYLRVVDEPTLTDSFTVRLGGRLELPNLPPISLTGVLRSELEDLLRTEIAKAIRSPQVTATSFIRISILGGVLRPGFYQVPAETPVSQALMLAGGLSTAGKADKTVVRRGADVVIDRIATRQLLASGLSLDQANLQAGDEVVVGERGGGSASLIGLLGGISAVLIAVVTIAR